MKRRKTVKTRTKGAPVVVGIGASAGGLEAFTALLKRLPLDTGLGFVLVQHLDPQHESALTHLLGRATSMPVREVTNNLRVEANCVYVIPPNTSLTIAQGVLKLQPRPQNRGAHRSIDFFFESLAQDQRERAIGVILSGTATDGTLGLEAIKAEGGITFAQDDSARYDSMPRSAVAAGCVDFVLKPEDIANELARIAKHPFVAGHGAEPPSPEDDRAFATAHEDDDAPLPSGGHGSPRTGARQARAEAEHARAEGETAHGKAGDNGFKKILLLLRNHCGVDFSLYKSSTIQRRISRRMVLNRHNTLEGYAHFLRGNGKELDTLYSDVLISVTSFFRNPEAFDVLRRRIFPKLLQQRGDEPLRVWVLGCSTGQEAYSIAMTFMESAESAPRMRKLQIFATDLNEALLDKARHGLYAKNLEQDVSPERLRRFFVEEEGGYRVSKPLRETIVFARQNLIGDPPFSRMDLISCRNLLIYLEPSLQKKALPTFHYALKPHGFLFLGASESIGGFTDLFEPADRKHKIYSRKAAPTPGFHLPVKKERGERPSPAPPRQVGTPLPAARGQGEPEGFRAELNSQREADRVTVSQYAPPGVLVNAELQVLQFRGPTGAYLEPPSGKASFDVLKMAREGLMLPLRAAISKARKENKTARRENVRFAQNGAARTVNVEVIPLKNLRERCFLILFEDAEKVGRRPPDRERTDGAARTRPAGKKEESRRVAGLERELAETRDYLQSIQEQHEAANEELQAANEEVQSANEELQSINEELETSKEELESANEELTTVNEEMANRNAELNRLNSDLVNLQTSTRLAIVLLARDLTIRRFSPQAEKLFNLLAADVGRPIRGIRHNLDLTDLDEFAGEVIASVREREREVCGKDGRWYSMRARPYMTLDNKVDGAVLVLVDIDALKRTESLISEARKYTEAIVRTMRDPLVVLHGDLRVQSANEAFYRAFKLSPPEAEGRSFFDLDRGAWNVPRLRHLLEDIIPRSSFFNDFQMTREFERIGQRTVLLNARTLLQADGKAKLVLLGIQDITEALHFQAAARQQQARFQALVQASSQMVWTTDAGGAVVDDSPSWRAFTGQTYEQWKGSGWLDALHPDDRERTSGLWRRAVAARVPLEIEYRLRHVSGDWRWMAVRAVPVFDSSGPLREWVGMNTDITERKLAAEALKRHAAQFEILLNEAPLMVYVVDADFRIRQVNPTALPVFGDIPGLIGRDFDEVIHILWPKAYADEIVQRFRHTLETGEPYVVSERIEERKDREATEYYEWQINRIPLPEGGHGVVCYFRDISARILAQQEIRESEERYRTLFASAPMAVFVCDRNAVIQYYNRRAVELWGREPVRGVEQHCGSVKLWLPDGALLPHAQSPIMDVLRTGIPALNVEVFIERPDGSRMPVLVNFAALKNAEGEVTGAITSFMDITERKEAEQRQQFLTNELAHRGRNLLAVVQVMVARSLSGTRSASEAREVLTQRIQALARSQSVLVSGGFDGAPVREIVRLEFEAFSERVAVAGPNVILNPKAGQTFALLLHELATNATKHGALSRQVGEIAIDWSVEGVGDKARFKFKWQERGGPLVVPPDRQGFGRTLLEKAAAQDFGAQPKLSFAPEGLIYEIDAPLSVVVADGAGGSI